ncbi:hypothetical protein [Sphingomonas profundi]|uniref:hypothetical protein n=1 Tax=Alterirhizorhabdus profundi TaxID=2681549 RepID=UPI0012E8402E|nr:hypothetical protein [Sphingomonas profundi]
MGPLFYVMAILGCGDAGGACQPVRVMDTHYASADACTAAVGQALMDATDLSFPEVTAECRPAPTLRTVAQEKPPRG